MCHIIWETCPSCECRSSQPTYYKAPYCPPSGCTRKVEKEMPAPRSRWRHFRCETEECVFHSENSDKLEKEYQKFGRVVQCFWSASAAPSPTGATVASMQDPLNHPNAPVAIHPAYLAEVSEASFTAGSAPETYCYAPSRPLPRWSTSHMGTPDMRRARKERKRISFGQPSKGDRVKTQFRSLGTVRDADLEPEVAEAIGAKKEAMDRHIEIQRTSLKRGAIPYLLEEDELLQMLRLNDYGFRQIHTDFMPHRTHGALIHRRNKHHFKHAKGFVYIPDDTNFDVEETGKGSASAGDEMEVDSASAIAETPEEDLTGDEMVVDQVSTTCETQDATPASEAMVLDQPESAHTSEQAPGNPTGPLAETFEPVKPVESIEEANPAAEALKLEAEVAVKLEAEEDNPTTDSETKPPQSTEGVKPEETVA